MKDPNKVIVINEKTGRTKVYTVNHEKDMAQQQFKEECDINNIIKKFHSTGEFTHLTKQTGMYADFSQVQDYQGMLHTVKDAQNAFMALPATVRKRFENDPGQLIQFLQNPSNLEEAISLGLAESSPILKQQISETENQLNNQTTKSTPKKSPQSPSPSTLKSTLE